jgi:hypothetical protein
MRTYVQRPKDNCRYLNTNAIRVSSSEGGGRHGHLGLIMMNDEYFALATDVFTAPENPGATPVHPYNITSACIAEANRTHKEAARIYHTYNKVNRAFKKLNIDAFEDQLLNHLLTYYAMIAPTELTQNYERPNTPYDPNRPNESLFQKIQDARAFAVPGCQP